MSSAARRPPEHAAQARRHRRRSRAAAEADGRARHQTIRPTRGGLLETLAPPLGQTIERGELLGRIVSPYTFETLEEIPTPYDSGIMILSHLGRNVVEAGDYAYMVGDLAGAER